MSITNCDLYCPLAYRLDAAKSELDRARVSRDAAKAELNATRLERDAAWAKYDRARADLKIAQAFAEDFRAHALKQGTELEALKRELAAVKAERDERDAGTQRDDVRAELAAALSQRDDARRERDDARADLASARAATKAEPRWALRDAQRAALAVAPDPGPGLRWNASADGTLDVDLIRRNLVIGWITLTARGWQPVLACSEYRGPRSHDPRVAMQAVLDALKEGSR